MADGCVSNGSPENQISDQLNPLSYLGYDSKKDVLIWKSSLEDLKSFCIKELGFREPLTLSFHGERSATLKKKGVSITFYLNTKTLLVQGASAVEFKRQLNSYLSPQDTRLPANKDEDNQSESEVQHQHLAFPDSQHEITGAFLDSQAFQDSRYEVADSQYEVADSRYEVAESQYEVAESQPNQYDRAFFESQHEVGSQPNQHGGAFPEPQHDRSELRQIKREIDQIWAILRSNPHNNDEKLQLLGQENEYLRKTIGSLKNQISNVEVERNSLRLALQIMARECTEVNYKNTNSSSMSDNNGPNVLITRVSQATQLHNNAKDTSQSLIELDGVMEASTSSNPKRKKRKKKKAKGTSAKSTNPLPPQSSTRTRNQESNTAKEPTNKDSRTVVVISDSIVKHVQGWKLSSSSRTVVKAFPGAKVDDIFHYVKPTLHLHPDEIIIHVGTNDVRNSNPRQVAERIVDLGNSIIADSPSTKVTLSSLISRSDDSALDEKVKQVNKVLNTFASQNEWDFLSHSNITTAHLNAGGLHLNHIGTKLLFSNLSKFINNN